MWDSSADGYARGEGIAVVVLKTLSRAIADGDSIESIIREVKVNQDGRTRGITMPSPTSQADLIRATYQSCNLDPLSKDDRCQYFEAHGTGTPAGDPVEARAVQSAFFPHQDSGTQGSLVVGSIKTVIGHTEGAAGLAGLLKASLAVQHGLIPANLHFNQLSPAVEPFCQHLMVPTSSMSWPETAAGVPRRVSVNSFGFGGTNSHAIIESWDGQEHGSSRYVVPYGPAVISAHSIKALGVAVSRILTMIKHSDENRLADILWTLQTKRSEHGYKASFAATDKTTYVQRLEDWLSIHVSDMTMDPVPFVLPNTSNSTPSILAVFTGQGAQWPQMGAKLLQSSARFRRTLKLLDHVLANLPEPAPWSLMSELLRSRDDSRIHQAAITQPLCTAVQIALVDLLTAAGVRFTKVVGHSSGEIAAAYTAGYITASDAIRISYYRGLCVSRLDSKQRPGGMLAADLSFAEAKAFCDKPRFCGRLTVAACNSPTSVTLSGDADAVEDAVAMLTGEKDVFARRLKVDTAYHSRHMLDCGVAYRKHLESCAITVAAPGSKGTCTWFSSVNPGEAIDPATLASQYWVDNMVQPVLFSQAIEAALSTESKTVNKETVVGIEIGPHPSLKRPVLDTISHLGMNIKYSGVLKRTLDDTEAFSEALGFLWEQFLPARSVVDFDGFRRACIDEHSVDQEKPHPRFCKDMPRYPWDHDRILWREPRLSKSLRLRSRVHPLLGNSTDIHFLNHSNIAHWRNILRLPEVEWLHGHKFQGQCLYPMAGYLSMAIDACVASISGPEVHSASLFELENATVFRALVLDEDTAGVEIFSSLRILQRQEDHILAEFSCSSLPVDNTRTGSGEAPVQNFSCQAKLSLSPNRFEPGSLLPSRVLQKGSSYPVDVEAFYSSIAQGGLQYAGDFKAQAVDKGDVNLSTVRYTRVQAPSILIHPVSLDVAFHGVFCALSIAHNSNGSTAFLPTTIDRVRVDIKRIREVNAARTPENEHRSNDMLADCYFENQESHISCDIDIFSSHELYPEIQIENLKCARFWSSANPEQDRMLFSRTTWKRDLTFGIRPNDLGGSTDYGGKTHTRIAEAVNRSAYFYLRKLRDAITFSEDVPNSESPGQSSNLWRDWIVHYVLPLVTASEPSSPRMQQWSRDTLEMITTLHSEHPESPDLKFIATIGNALPDMLRHDFSLTDLLAQDSLKASVEQIGGLGLPKARNLAAAAIAQVAHRYPHMNIIQIGAGKVSGTNSIFEHLKESSFDSYTVSDSSVENLNEVQCHLGQDRRLKYLVLDIEKETVSENSELGSYELVVVASDIWPRLRDSITVLQNCRRLLRPGGFLLVVSRTNQQSAYAQYISAFTQQWPWKLSAVRQKDAFPLTESRWHNVLLQAGFSGVDWVTRDLENEDEYYNFSVMMGQAVDEHVSMLRDPLSNYSVIPASGPLSATSALPSVLIIGADSLPILRLAHSLKAVLAPFTAETTIVDSFDDVPHPFHGEASVICLSELNESIIHGMSVKRFQALQDILCQASHVLWLTKGRRDANPYANIVVGLARSVVVESPGRPMQFIDLEDGIPEANWLAAAFLRMLLLDRSDFKKHSSLLWSNETELAVDNRGSVWLPRIAPDKPLNERLAARLGPKTTNVSPLDTPVTLVLMAQMTGYQLLQMPESVPPAASRSEHKQYNVDVEYSSLSAFRTKDAGKDYFLSVGVDRDNGRRLLVLSSQNGSHVAVSADKAWTIDPCTVSSNSILLQNLQRYLVAESLTLNCSGKIWLHNSDAAFGESLRVHAQRVGLDIFFTTSDASSDASCGTFVHPQITLRRLRQIAPTDVAVFANFSRGREESDHTALGKQISSILKGTAQSCEFPVVDENGQAFVSLEYSQSRLQEIIGLFLGQPSSESEPHHVLDSRTVPLATIIEKPGRYNAFDIVDWSRKQAMPAIIKPLDASKLFSPTATYLLAGLTGDLGLSLCRWMASQGAKYIILGSRKPSVSQDSIAQLELQGATVKVLAIDIVDRISVEKARTAIEACSMPPVRGVVNGAMVLRDRLFENMSMRDLMDALAPKVQGTRNLDLVFGHSLDFFVLLSSIASVIGLPGLSNYGAANAFMQSFAQQRRKRGLPASVLDMSVLSEHGYIVRSSKHSVQTMMDSYNLLPVSDGDFHMMFAEAVHAGCSNREHDAQIMTGIGQWNLTNYQSVGHKQDVMPIWYSQPRLSFYLSTSKDAPGDRKDLKPTESNIRDEIASLASSQHALDVLTSHVIRKLERLLQMPVGSVTAQLPLIKLGADSILATRLRSWLATELNVALPALKILASPSVGHMCEDILAQIIGISGSGQDHLGVITQDDSSLIFKSTLQEPSAPSVPSTSSQESFSLIDVQSNTNGAPSSVGEMQEEKYIPGRYEVEPLVEEKEEQSQVQSPKFHFLRVGHVSHGQKGLYVTHKYVDDKSTYTCGAAGKVHGPLNIHKLKEALHRVAMRHEGLRSCFFLDEPTGQVLQGVMETADFALDHKSVDDHREGEREEWIEKLKKHEFDIEHGKVMRILVLSKSATEHDIIIVYHHIIMDGISLVVFLHELSMLYSGHALGDAPMQAIELSTRQQEASNTKALQDDLKYWREMYPVPPAVLPLHNGSKTKYRVPLNAYNSHSFEVKLDAKFTDRIRSKSNQIGATNFHLYTAAFSAFISRWLNISDINVGIVDSNRPAVVGTDNVDESETIGYFLNFVALRLGVDAEALFDDLVVQTRDTAFAALSHATTPFQTILDHLRIPRDAACHPLFQVAVNYRVGHLSTSTELGKDCTLELDEAIVARSAFDIHLDITDFREGGAWVSIFLQSSLYDSSVAERLTKSFIQALEKFVVADDSTTRIKDCPTAGDADIQQAVVMGRGTSLAMDPWPETLAHRVDDIALLHPDDVAIREGSVSDQSSPARQMTYSEMVRRSLQIAVHLLQHGVGPGSFVGVYMSPMADSVCSMLAIMRVGAIYVPLDMMNPAERLELMVLDTKPTAIISWRSHMDMASLLCAQGQRGSTVLYLDDLVPSMTSSPNETARHWQLASAAQPACVLFTSGSTGRPKGVVLLHRNLINQIRVITQTMGLQREVVMQQSSLGFDPSLEQIFGGLANGGTVIIIPEAARRDPIAIADIMVKESVTYTIAVPSEYASLLRYGGPTLSRGCRTWRLAVSGGEKLTSRLLAEFVRLDLPDLELINAYGPTEGTVSCTRGLVDYHSSTDDADMGRVLPNYLVLIVQPDTLQPVPIGLPGEVLIGGEGVASHYLNRPDETQARFIPSSLFSKELGLPETRFYRTGDSARMSEDGRLHSLGRIEGDSQVKLRGVRIELDEVAKVMARTGGFAVSDVALSLRDGDLLVAFVVFAFDFEGDKSLFLSQLVGQLPLPAHMRPAMALPIEKLPLTPNGKKDQRAIDKLDLHQTAERHIEPAPRVVTSSAEPRQELGGLTPLDISLREAWEEVLPSDHGSISNPNSDFFAVGGNSLLLLRLQSVLSATLGIRIPLPKLFQSSSFEGMTALIKAEQDNLQGTDASPSAIDWHREIAALADQLRPPPPGVAHPPFVPTAPKLPNGLSVLVTGATGFVGTSLLQRLIDDPKVCEVHCIAIRPDRHGHARHLTKVQGTWAVKSKIREYTGDLKDRYLGLSREDFNRLGATVDVIIHNGADVSLLKTYATLRRPNVLASRRLIEMALSGSPSRQIPIHFVSTASVACFAQNVRPSPPAGGDPESIEHFMSSALPPISLASFPPTANDATVQGYRCSKWASEVLFERAVTENPAAGLRIFIHRPTSILGPGASDTDALGSIVRASTQLRVAPRLDSTVNGVLDLIDVEDVVSGVLKHALDVAVPVSELSTKTMSTIKFVHHCNPHKMHLAHLGKYLSEKLGYQVEECDLPQWLERARGKIGSLMDSFMKEWESRDQNKILFPIVKE